MNRFHVFVGDAYYLSGGIEDYKASTPTLEEAEALVGSLRHPNGYDWWQIAETLPNGSLSLVKTGGD